MASVRYKDAATNTDVDGAVIGLALQYLAASSATTSTALPREPRQRASFRSLPDQLCTRIFEHLSHLSEETYDRVYGIRDGWYDLRHSVPEILDIERNLRQLRLVSRHWLHLSLDVYWRHFLLQSPRCCTRTCWPRCLCDAVFHRNDISRLEKLLLSSPPPRLRNCTSSVREASYGTYIQNLALPDQDDQWRLTSYVLANLAELMPNIRNIHVFSAGGATSQILAPLLATRLPHLEGITEIWLTPPSGGDDSDQYELQKKQDTILELVSKNPRLKRFSASGFVLDDDMTMRFLTSLTTNRLFHLPEIVSGLTHLHFADKCSVDVTLLAELAKAAPNLIRFVIGPRCKLTDTKDKLKTFKLADLVSSLSQLQSFTFIGTEKILVTGDNSSSKWADCSNIIQVRPSLTYLNVRADQVDESFFRLLNRTAGFPHFLYQPLEFLFVDATALYTDDNEVDDLLLHNPRRIRIFLDIIIKFLDGGVQWPTSDSKSFVKLFAKLLWMIKEREASLDEGKMKMLVHVQSDASATTEFVMEGVADRSSSSLTHQIVGPSRGVVVVR